MSRKTKTFNQLIDYIDLPVEKAKKTILFNLRSKGDTPQEIKKEFQKNAQFCGVRKNGVYLYHEILSFSGADKEEINEAILEDLAEHYLQERAAGALAYGRIHFNRENPHIHLMISANEINSPKKIRLSKAQFSRVKRDLEAYQKEYYPQLKNSIAQGEGKPRTKTKPAEIERAKRLTKAQKQVPSKKEEIKIFFLQKLSEARSHAVFEEILKAEGFSIYQRGKTLGICDQDGKKYRLKTLGVLNDFEKRTTEWQRKTYRKSTLIEIEKQKQKNQFRGFKKAVLTVIKTHFSKRAKQLWDINRNQTRQFFRGRGRK